MVKNKLKIAAIGGGSSYTPELIEGFINRRDELPIEEIWLVDIEQGRKKLEIVSDFATRMVQHAGCDIKIINTMDRKAALKDADFVLTQLRVGGLEARIRDERIPLKYGCIGQETTGPGGFTKALRTIPVILDICDEMAQLCPDAWLINFTNPSGIITETVLNFTNIKSMGLCNFPAGLQNRIAKINNCAPKDVYCDLVGLNHLQWARRITVRGEDITRSILDTADQHKAIMKHFPTSDMGDTFFKSLGMLPISYLQYYYLTKEVYEECLKQSQEAGVRGELVQKVEDELFALYADPNVKTKPQLLAERGGANYSDAACGLISSIYNDKHDMQVVCVKNNGANLDLPEDAVIERNSIIGKHGAQPIALGHMPLKIRGLIQTVKAYEQLTVQAGVYGDRNAALQALTLHPLVPSASAAVPMLDELISANIEYLPQFQ